MQFSNFSRIVSGNTILIKNEIPIENVQKIKYFTDNSYGTFLKKEVRWSFSGTYWSSWVTLTQRALSSIDTHANPYMFMEMRYVLTEAGSGDVTVFVLNYTASDATYVPAASSVEIQANDTSAKLIHDVVQKYVVTRMTDASTLNGYPGSWYLNRTNHTGTQPINSITGLPLSLTKMDGSITDLYNTKVNRSGDTMTGRLVVPDVSGVHNLDFVANTYVNQPYRLAWDDGEGTLSFGLPDGGSIQMGKETFDYYTNLSGTTLVDGDVVSVIGVAGNRSAVTLTDAKVSQIATAAIGMVTNGPIAPNGIVRVTKIGDVHGLNTNNFVEGMPVYVDPSNNGKLTQNIPAAPNTFINVGIVVVKNQNVGIISVDLRPVGKLVNLSDVAKYHEPLNATGQFPSWDKDSSFFCFKYNINDYLKEASLNQSTFKWVGGYLEPSIVGGTGDVTKAYVDSSLNNKVSKTGDTMSGGLIISTSIGQALDVSGNIKLIGNIVTAKIASNTTIGTDISIGGSSNIAIGNFIQPGGSSLQNTLIGNYISETGKLISRSVILGFNAARTIDQYSQRNVVIGSNALSKTGTSLDSVVIGFYACSSVNYLKNTIAIGQGALQIHSQETTDNGNIAIGYHSMQNVKIGERNTAIGESTMEFSESSYDNTAVGYNVLLGGIGTNNDAFGSFALSTWGSGNYNSAFGSGALGTLLEGSSNIGIGYNAGPDSMYSNRSIFIGANSVSATQNSYNEVVIGTDAIGNGDNTLTLGNNECVATYLKGNIILQNKNISGVQTPVDSSDATNKYYVDNELYSYETATRIIYVDSSAGSDVTGTGKIDSPYKTLSKTFSSIKKNLGANTILIDLSSGDYTYDASTRGYHQSLTGGTIIFVGKFTTDVSNLVITRDVSNPFKYTATVGGSSANWSSGEMKGKFISKANPLYYDYFYPIADCSGNVMQIATSASTPSQYTKIVSHTTNVNFTVRDFGSLTTKTYLYDSQITFNPTAYVNILGTTVIYSCKFKNHATYTGTMIGCRPYTDTIFYCNYFELPASTWGIQLHDGDLLNWNSVFAGNATQIYKTWGNSYFYAEECIINTPNAPLIQNSTGMNTFENDGTLYVYNSNGIAGPMQKGFLTNLMLNYLYVDSSVNLFQSGYENQSLGNNTIIIEYTPLGKVINNGKYFTDPYNNVAISLPGTSSAFYLDPSMNMLNNRIHNLGAPIDSSDAANKWYVDSSIAIRLKEASIGPDFTWNAGYLALQTNDLTITSSENTIKIYSDASNLYIDVSDYVSKTYVNSSLGNYVNKAGDTMTGTLFNSSTGISIDVSGYILTTSSSSNVRLGLESLSVSSPGKENTAIGKGTLKVNTGNYNTAVGFEALNKNTTGRDNTAMGDWTMIENTIGQYNTALGSGVLWENRSGNNNTGVGSGTILLNVSGHKNTALGYASLYSVVDGSANIALGYNALSYLEHGNYNIALGYYAGDFTSIGNNTSANNSIFIGNNTKSLYNDDYNEIVIGNNVTGLGSNTIVLGDSSITKTLLRSNVGINQPDPQFTLDVSGNARITGGLLGHLREVSLGPDFTWNAGYLALQSNDLTITSSENTIKIYSDASNLYIDVSDYVSKTYVNSSLGNYVKKTGDTMSGSLIVNASLVINSSSYLNGDIITSGDILLTKGGLGTMGPTIYLKNTSIGAVDSEFGFMGAGLGSTSAVHGPAFGMRGNYFSRTANQRGYLYFYAGSPTGTATGLDGALEFATQKGYMDFLIGTSYASVMRIKNDGKIGINNINPVYTLDISGNINFTNTSGILYKGGNRFLHTFGTNNVFLGENAGNLTLSSANQNVGIGLLVLDALTSGFDNVGVGYAALSAATTASRNMGLGTETLQNLINGDSNIAIGNQAMRNSSSGNYNVAIGGSALYNSKGSDNVAIGLNSGKNVSTGYRNTFIGAYSGDGFGNVQKFDVVDSIAIGYASYTTKNYQTVIGGPTTAETLIFGANIGIGTSEPSTQLHVVGTVRLDGSVGISTTQTLIYPLHIGSGTYITSTGNIKIGNGGQGIGIDPVAGGANANIFFGTGGVIGFTGTYTNFRRKVAIGTDATSNIFTLDVSGPVRIDGSLNMNNQLVSDVATPVSSSDATNRWYVDTSLFLRLKEASLNTSTFKWVGGLLEPSVASGTGDVTKAYVDGSLALRDVSIKWLSDNMSGGVSVAYVDGSLARRDASLNNLYLFNTAEEASISNLYARVNYVDSCLGWSSILSSKSNASLGLFNPATINASMGAINVSLNVLTTLAYKQDVSIGIATALNTAEEASIANLYARVNYVDSCLGWTSILATKSNASLGLINIATLNASIGLLNASVNVLTTLAYKQDVSIGIATALNTAQEASISNLYARVNYVDSCLGWSSVLSSKSNASLGLFNPATLNASIGAINVSLNLLTHLSYKQDVSIGIATALNTAEEASIANLYARVNYVDSCLGWSSILSTKSNASLGLFNPATINASIGNINTSLNALGLENSYQDVSLNDIWIKFGYVDTCINNLSVGAGVTQAYVDGSLVRRDASLNNLYLFNTAEEASISNLYARVNYVDSCLGWSSVLSSKSNASLGLFNPATINASIGAINVSLNVLTTLAYKQDVSIGIATALNTAQEASISLALTKINVTDVSLLLVKAQYIPDVSLNQSKFKWLGGYLEPSVAGGSGDVTKAYVDGSLAIRDASIQWIFDNPGGGGASYTYVDGSLAQIKARYIPDSSLNQSKFKWVNNFLEPSVASSGTVGVDPSSDYVEYMPFTGEVSLIYTNDLVTTIITNTSLGTKTVDITYNSNRDVSVININNYGTINRQVTFIRDVYHNVTKLYIT